MDTFRVPGTVVCPFSGLLGDGSHLESLMHNKQLLFFVTPGLFFNLPREAKYSSCPLCPVLEAAQKSISRAPVSPWVCF